MRENQRVLPALVEAASEADRAGNDDEAIRLYVESMHVIQRSFQEVITRKNQRVLPKHMEAATLAYLEGNLDEAMRLYLETIQIMQGLSQHEVSFRNGDQENTVSLEFIQDRYVALRNIRVALAFVQSHSENDNQNMAHLSYAWNQIAMELDKLSFAFDLIHQNTQAVFSCDPLYAWNKTAELANLAGLTVKAAYAYRRLYDITQDPIHLLQAVENRIALFKKTERFEDYTRMFSSIDFAIDCFENTALYPPEEKIAHIKTIQTLFETVSRPGLPSGEDPWCHNPYSFFTKTVPGITSENLCETHPIW